MTRLFKTKMFSEQLVIDRAPNTETGWSAPTKLSDAVDKQINDWVDKTGNEVVSVSTPGLYMTWLDPDKIKKLIFVSVMVMYIPSVPPPKVVSSGEHVVSNG